MCRNRAVVHEACGFNARLLHESDLMQVKCCVELAVLAGVERVQCVQCRASPRTRNYAK